MHFILDRGRTIGSMLEMTGDQLEDTCDHWIIYLSVKNCDITINQAISLRGEICVSDSDIPDVGRFSIICDYQGAVFSVIQSVMDDV